MRIRKNILLLCLSALSFLLLNCDVITPQDENGLAEFSCEGCHTNAGTLDNVITALNLDSNDQLATIPGQSTVVTALSLKDKVWIRLDSNLGINSFKDIDSTHSKIGCSGCHGGESNIDASDDTSAYRTAHAGLMRDPSEIDEVGCAGGMCHGDIVRRHKTSMHGNLTGQKAHVALRNVFDTFEECPADVKDAFSEDCSSCHATCGQCHISRPTSAGGGFLEQGSTAGSSHKFIRTPDEANVCTSCHSSRIGDDWKGNLAGNEADVHQQMGKTCLDCHTEDLHGDGSNDANYTSRYQVAGLPQCVDCHQDDQDDNAYHQKHWPNSDATDGPDLACSVCHSQQYTNCNTCHAGEWMNEYSSNHTEDYRVYSSFKVGHNPYYGDAGHPNNNSAWITVRHVPVSPDTYTAWGINIMPNFDIMETWKYTSPHNIQRWTDQTLVSEADSALAVNAGKPLNDDDGYCFIKCHYNDGLSWHPAVNTEIYIKQTDLESDVTGDDLSAEIQANIGVLVDGSFTCTACHL